MKRVISIISVIFLLSVTMLPSWGYSYFVYADTNDSATDIEKQQAAMTAYFNYRGGNFTSTSGASAAVTIMNRYINEFYDSDANTTGISSTSDFVNHITVNNNDGHWNVKLDNEGVVFLDHLCKWMLGKNDFPNLYSGGSWGSDGTTTDTLYDGYTTGYGLFYILNGSDTDNISESEILSAGSPVNGFTTQYMKNLFTQQNPNFSFTSTYSGQSATAVPITIKYSADAIVSTSIKYTAGGAAGRPDLRLSSSYPFHVIYYERTYDLYGFPCWYINRGLTPTDRMYYGTLTYNSGNNGKYKFESYGYYDQNNKPNDIVPSKVDFNSKNFDRNDVGDENNNDAPDVNFTPKVKDNTTGSDGVGSGSDGIGDNTYNYYIYNDYTEKTFIENYIENYVEENTKIIKDGVDPDSGSGEGGSGEGGSGNDGSGYGTITPDGNGGFHFQLPDVGIPNFDGFNWSISGLTEKFPFSIPFDLIAFFTVLNAEPETPELQATIPLGRWEWSIDWDLHNFDNIAALLRNLEFIGFCIALILITRSIIKG